MSTQSMWNTSDNLARVLQYCAILIGSFVRGGSRSKEQFSLNRSLFPFSDAYPPANDIRFLLSVSGVENEFILNPPIWWIPRDYFRENERGLRTISLEIHISRSSSATTLGKNRAITVNRRTSREIGVN